MAPEVKVGLIGSLDMLKFKNMKELREKTIQAAPAREIRAEFPINKNAAALHPHRLKLKVAEIIEHKAADARTLILTRPEGGPLPCFRAGQFISLKLAIGGSLVSRPYTLCSSPSEALDGRYAVTIKRAPGNLVSAALLTDTRVGDEISCSGPAGLFYYESLRDCKTAVCVAGGSGITPFLSLAKAVRDGVEELSMILLYGSPTFDSILFRRELEWLCFECPRIRVVHVLSHETMQGCEKGFITADLIRKYVPEGTDYTLFFCGPESMRRFLEPELAKLKLPAHRIRCHAPEVTKTIADCPEYPQDAKGKTFRITVRQGPKEYTLEASAAEPILTALERAGISAPSRCRSGECGWCRSKLLSGTCFCPKENEHRRKADISTGYIHPCASFPTSDLLIEIPGEY